MAVEIGKVARVVTPIVQGAVIDTEYDKDAKCLRHLLEYEDGAGETQQRWFVEADLEEVLTEDEEAPESEEGDGEGEGDPE
jgi:hypothetical protein